MYSQKFLGNRKNGYILKEKFHTKISTFFLLCFFPFGSCLFLDKRSEQRNRKELIKLLKRKIVF